MWLPLGFAAAMLIGGCAPATNSPSASASPTTTASSATEAASATASPTPGPTPEPSLSLEPSGSTDPRQVTVAVLVDVAPDGGGNITVSLVSSADELIDEVVLRWPTDLEAALFLAPFIPDPALVQEGGGNLVRTWTKWVTGPGEQGEPAGTTSLGYGPLEPGATLEIPLFVTRNAPGPVSFDLQVLAGEGLLTMPDGAPAELRVEVP